jgi:GNAT superfamily N-acetyltransferase
MSPRRPEPLHVQIRPLAEPEIRLLEWHLPEGQALHKHRRRFERQQADEVLYLAAWYDEQPIGHILVNWPGPPQAELASLRDCPNLEDLRVSEPFRCRGVGSQLLARAEGLAVQRGIQQVGLAVGVANRRARKLYLRRGYQDSGLGEFVNRWRLAEVDGREQWGEERCVYLVKRLAPPP